MRGWMTVLAMLFFLLCETTVHCGEPLVVGPFSSASVGGVFPQGWEPMVFEKIKTQTRYTLETGDGTVVVKAESRAGASGMIRKIDMDPYGWPILSWRWKVDSVYIKGDATRKKGDDYPARIYVAFAYDPDKLSFTERLKFKAAKTLYGEYPPMAVLNYIWASNAPVGQIIPNAYTDRAMMIVVESGPQKTGTWLTETRNIVEDYQKAFGSTPPPISGIAIMTDSDNTGESATAWYGDIQLLQAD